MVTAVQNEPVPGVPGVPVRLCHLFLLLLLVCSRFEEKRRRKGHPPLALLAKTHWNAWHTWNRLVLDSSHHGSGAGTRSSQGHTSFLLATAATATAASGANTFHSSGRQHSWFGSDCIVLVGSWSHL